MFGSGFHQIAITPIPPASCSSSHARMPLSSAATRPTNNYDLSTSTTEATSSGYSLKYGPVHGKNHKRASSEYVSVSAETRKAAIVDLQECSDLESALARYGKILKVQDLNVVLRHFGKLKRWKELSQLFDWMQQNEKTNVASYSGYIKFMGSSINPIKGLEIYNSIKDGDLRNNVSVCNSILSCLVKNGKFQSSLKLFNQMKQNGLKPDIVTYSTLLVGCGKAKGGFSKALELIQELKYHELRMDSVIYGTLLSVCASNNEREEAEKYFEEMKSEGHSPNMFHYSSLLNAYSSEGDYKKADELIQEMRTAGLTLNKVILTTLLKVYVRGQLFEKSRELLKELENLGYAANEMPYCILLDGLVKDGQVLEAKSVFEEMMNKDVKSDGFSYSIMISAFCRSGLLEEAKQLASVFEEKYDKYDLVILNTMLSVYCRAREMDNVMKIMRKMDKLAITPDWNTFHILVNYFCNEKLYTVAYRTLEDMQKKGYQPEEELCISLINHLGRTGAHKEAFSVYNMLRYSKRTMCKDLHERILYILVAGDFLKDAYVVVKDNAGFISKPAIAKFATSFVKSGNINLINDVIKVVHSSGLNLNQELFHMAIARYLEETEKKQLLFQLLQWMPGQGYYVDSSTRNLLLQKSHLFGRQTIAELLSKQQVYHKQRNVKRQ